MLGLDIGNLVGGWLNYEGQKQANKTNLAIARENNEWNERMWHMQNAYNSPAEQMARYKAAGLNPNLIYGSTSNGNANSFPTAESVSVQNNRAGDALLGQLSVSLGGLLDMFKKKEEIETQKAQTDNIRADTLSKVNQNTVFDHVGLQLAYDELDYLDAKISEIYDRQDLRQWEKKQAIKNLELIKKNIELKGQDITLGKYEINRQSFYNRYGPNPRNLYELPFWLVGHGADIFTNAFNQKKLTDNAHKLYNSYISNVASPIQSGFDKLEQFFPNFMNRILFEIMKFHQPHGNWKK